MAFPDRIERTVELRTSPDVVWKALTTAEGLGTWFGNDASIELHPGGAASLRWTDGAEAELRIERVEEPRVFAFTWRVDGTAADDPRRTYVEFVLEPDGAGTRLHLRESGFAQLPADQHRAGYDSHSEGWTRELGELVEYVGAG